MAVELRPREAGDEQFVRAVYASTRQPELALLAWNPAQQEAFLDLQFRAFEQHVAQMTGEVEQSIVVVDGEPAGRLDVERTSEQIGVVAIALLPAFRGRGVGATLLSELADEADDAGLPLRLHVDGANDAAARLYERLGFRPVREEGFYRLLERPPSSRRTPGSASRPRPARSAR